MIEEFKEKFEKRHQVAEQIKKDGKKIIGCFYGSVPKELVHSAGMVPVQLVEDRNYQYEAKSGLLPYLCGMSKNLTGQIYDKVFDYVDAVMVSTVCDTNRHVPDIWERNKVFPKIWIVRAPIKADDEAVSYYTREVQRLSEELGRLSGKKVTEEDLGNRLPCTMRTGPFSGNSMRPVRCPVCRLKRRCMSSPQPWCCRWRSTTP